MCVVAIGDDVELLQTTKALLQTLSCKYLSGEGDIIKHLTYIGYSVSYCQVL